MKSLLILASLMMLAASSPPYVDYDVEGGRVVSEPGIYIPHRLWQDEHRPGLYIPHTLRQDLGQPGVYIPHTLRKELGQPGVYIPPMPQHDIGQPGVYIPHSHGRVISMDHWDWTRPRLAADNMPGVSLLDPRAALTNVDSMDMEARGWFGKGLSKGLKWGTKNTLKGFGEGAGEQAINLLANAFHNGR